MKTIYKYPLNPDPDGVATFDAPGGTILKIAMQNEKPFAWVEHNIGNPPRPYRLRFVATGEHLPGNFGRDWTYIDTIFIREFVFHIYEGHA